MGGGGGGVGGSGKCGRCGRWCERGLPVGPCIEIPVDKSVEISVDIYPLICT